MKIVKVTPGKPIKESKRKTMPNEVIGKKRRFAIKKLKRITTTEAR